MRISLANPHSSHGSLIQTMTALMLASAAVLAAAVLATTDARAQSPAAANQDVVGGDMIVKYDQSQIFELSRPATEIIIGNPVIADVSVQSGTTLVVTGKTFGVTNIIVLDAERRKIAEQRVIVIRDDARTVNLYRATKRQSYNCSPGQACNPSLVIGDDPEYFAKTQAAAQGKIGFSASGGEGGGGAGGGGGGQPQQ